MNSWTPSVATPDASISVVQRPSGGATLISTPRAGGTLFGFNIDPRMDMVGAGQKVLDGAWSDASVSYVNGRPVTTSVADGAVFINVFDQTLESPQFITKVPGSYVAEPSFYNIQGSLVMPVVDDTGLWMYRFDDSLEPIDAKHIKTTEPARSLTVGQFGSALFSAWSTDTKCYLNYNATYATGMNAVLEAPCGDPKLAINETNGDGIMLFDSNDGVRLMNIHLTQMGGDARLMRTGTSSPRALFDGTNYWVSWLDARGDIIVGFLDANHNPVTMSLGQPQPDRLGYELVNVEGSPWIFSLDTSGYNAYRMCVDTIW